ncbi:beta-lactamase family protein [Roseibacterium sp. SDUM158016]|uniref:serine hydrolase domain-containing protein n=1 Tax=Roseicyclus sediminis TaxID=2980997 RepID=UPI0021CE3C29|nr:serine hydrolase domain-containing protein [Roseibacterium sp. SDUM158016]MCU4653449.1 beta-lactamase family protein [Roseibacterium sp. SDUM158016]
MSAAIVVLAAFLLVVMAPLAAVCAQSSVAAQPAGDPLLEGLAATARDRMEADDVPGVVIAVLRDGILLGPVALGLADPSAGREMTADALFRVESISKPVTAWGVMRLAETGRLDLDGPIADCLLRWRPPDGVPAITVRQLLSHSAGIGIGDYAARYRPGAPRPTLPDFLEGDFRMVGVPGEGFAYSDTGYNLLELVVEDCAGEEFGAFMAREILRPLGMTGAGYDWRAAAMPVGHDLRGRAVAPYVYPARGSGGLFATAEDIARLAAASMAGSDQAVLPAGTVALMQAPRIEVGGLFGFAAAGYGLGHFTETLSDGRAAIWHGGQGYGWMSHMHVVPETGDGIVILSNSQRAWPLFAAVLREWSGSLGVEPVGMARVLWAETVAKVAVAALLAAGVLAAWSAARGAGGGAGGAAAAGISGVVLIGWPIWAARQDYLFLFSILPGLWPLLAVASILSGLALLALAAARWRRT